MVFCVLCLLLLVLFLDSVQAEQRYKCDNCRGIGVCPSCVRTGICNQCKGRGYCVYNCGKCNGTGSYGLIFRSKCDKCNNGQLSQTCNFCDGYGRCSQCLTTRKCHKCRGYGVIWKYSDYSDSYRSRSNY